ncbi:unnamed protein product [Prunus brigantina]
MPLSLSNLSILKTKTRLGTNPLSEEKLFLKAQPPPPLGVGGHFHFSNFSPPFPSSQASSPLYRPSLPLLAIFFFFFSRSFLLFWFAQISLFPLVCCNCC